jgi:hypothetical protein
MRKVLLRGKAIIGTSDSHAIGHFSRVCPQPKPYAGSASAATVPSSGRSKTDTPLQADQGLGWS